MAEKTVREQLVEALEGHGCQVARADHPPCIDERPARTLWCDTCLALDRARAEPEGHCKSTGYLLPCDTSCPCYQEGLEAQREPAGRGTP